MFAFSQVEPETSGTVTKIPTPISRYLGASWDQGKNDSLWNSITRMSEFKAAEWEDSPTLDPELATKQYGIPGRLEFKEPVKDSVAQLLHDRKRAEMDRQFLMDTGSRGYRWLPGMATSFVASILNPLDFGALFIPIVGEEKLALTAAKAGRGAIRQALARGIVSVEALERARIPAPRLVSSVIQGTIGQGMYEIPNAIASSQDQADYTREQFLANVVAGGLLAGGIHLGVTAAAKLYRRLAPATKEAMVRQAINDFLTDVDSNPAKYAEIDETAIKAAVAAEHKEKLRIAAKSVSMDDVKRVIKEELHEEIRAAAVEFTNPKTGARELRTGFMHAEITDRLIQEFGDDLDLNKIADGFYTTKERFVDREMAADLVGLKQIKEMDSEHIYGTTEQSELEIEEMVREGVDRRQAETMVRQRIEEKREAAFFARKDVQKILQNERNKRVKAAVEQAKRDFDPNKRFDELKQQELDKLKNNGKTVKPEEIQQHTKPEVLTDKEVTDLDNEINSLKEELELEDYDPADDPDLRDPSIFTGVMERLDSAIKALETDPTKMMIDPFLLQTLGKPLLRGLLIVIRAALRSTMNVTYAVDEGIYWLKKSWDKRATVKDVKEVAVLKSKPGAKKLDFESRFEVIEEKKPSKGLSRRSFIQKMSAAFAGAQIPINPEKFLSGVSSIGEIAKQVVYFNREITSSHLAAVRKNIEKGKHLDWYFSNVDFTTDARKFKERELGDIWGEIQEITSYPSEYMPDEPEYSQTANAAETIQVVKEFEKLGIKVDREKVHEALGPLLNADAEKLTRAQADEKRALIHSLYLHREPRTINEVGYEIPKELNIVDGVEFEKMRVREWQLAREILESEGVHLDPDASHYTLDDIADAIPNVEKLSDEERSKKISAIINNVTQRVNADPRVQKIRQESAELYLSADGIKEVFESGIVDENPESRISLLPHIITKGKMVSNRKYKVNPEFSMPEILGRVVSNLKDAGIEKKFQEALDKLQEPTEDLFDKIRTSLMKEINAEIKKGGDKFKPEMPREEAVITALGCIIDTIL